MVNKVCLALQISLLGEKKTLSLAVALFLEQVLFLMEISFINVEFPHKWENVYF